MATRRTARPKTIPEAVAELEAPAAMQVTTLPLTSLVLSGLNVRQTERDADIAALAEDIAAIGLLQPLLVTPAHFSTAEVAEGDNYGDRFEVIGGGRRVQALQLLAREGRLPQDYAVPVVTRLRSDARTVSLSENLHRVAMNPADEFEAYRQIVDEHGGDDSAISLCARRFGVSARHVAERLRLAALSPTVMEALRSGTIGVDSAKAYATHADHALQDKVFASQAKSNYQPHAPRAVRDALRGLTVGLDDLRFEYVGALAYRAAGGRTEVEMFMGDAGTERVVDVALLDKLVAEKAEGEIAAIVAEQGWASGQFAKGTGYAVSLPKTPKGHTVLSRWQNEPEGEARVGAIGVFSLARGELPDDAPEDARGEPVLEYYCAFVPEANTDEGNEADQPPKSRADWQAEQAERVRWHAATHLAGRWAATEALAKLGLSAGDADLVWPDSRWTAQVETDDDSGDHLLIAVQVRVSKADLEARREEASTEIDRAASAEQAESEEEQ